MFFPDEAERASAMVAAACCRRAGGDRRNCGRINRRQWTSCCTAKARSPTSQPNLHRSRKVDLILYLRSFLCSRPLALSSMATSATEE